jgi:site-specific recombinase XerD
MPKSSSNPTFATLLQRFFVDHLQQDRALSPCTISAYRDTFKLLLCFAERRFGKKPANFTLTDLDQNLVLAFLDHLEHDRGNTARSRNARRAALRTFLKYAAHYDVTALPVIERTLEIPLKRYDRPMLGFLSRPRDRVLLTMLYNTGARVSEIIGVRFKDLVLEHAPSVHLHGKGRKDRTVPLWSTSTSLLGKWKRHLIPAEDSDFLLPNRNQTKMTRSNVTQRLQRAVRLAAEKCPSLRQRVVSPHTIRHTTAMHLLQSGVDITVIALWLGHESPSTTHLYIEADLSMKQRALNRLQPAKTGGFRYRPPEQLLHFLESL